MTLEPFALLAGGLPLIGYVLVLSIIRVSGRSLVTTGGRDIAALMCAVAGLVVIGPAELFFPYSTATLLGAWVWLPLAILYFLVILLTALTSRARLVVYGRESDALFPALLRACETLDAGSVGDASKAQVHMPTLGVHLRIDGVPNHDCLTIESFETQLSPAFWDSLLATLRGEVRSTPPPRRRRGLGMLLLGLAALVLVTRHCVGHADELADGFRRWLIR